MHPSIDQSSEIDFKERLIPIRAFNTKTMRERQVAITERLNQRASADVY
jgi:hypothetical protein